MRFLALALLLTASPAFAWHPNFQGDCFKTSRPGEFLIITSTEINAPFEERLNELEKKGFTVVNKFPLLNSALVVYKRGVRLTEKEKRNALSDLNSMLEDGSLAVVTCNVPVQP